MRLWLDIQCGRKRVVLDEFAARLDHIAHQLGEQIVGLVGMLALSPAAACGHSRRAWFPTAVRAFISPRPL